MFTRDHIYTVHVNPDRQEPCERTIVVREGFSLLAFFFTIFWSLYHRLWVFSVFYLVLAALVYAGAQYFGLHENTHNLLQLGLQTWFGFAAHDWQREALARRGYEETAVVCASSPLLAEQRHYDHQTA